MADDETGELLVERRLDHENGEAAKFYHSLQKPVRVGIEATGPIHWFVRLLAELGHDSRQRSTQTEDRRARRSAHSRSPAFEAFSQNLGAHSGGTRSPAVALASPQARNLAHHAGQSTALSGDEPGPVPQAKAV